VEAASQGGGGPRGGGGGGPPQAHPLPLLIGPCLFVWRPVYIRCIYSLKLDFRKEKLRVMPQTRTCIDRLNYQGRLLHATIFHP